MEVAWRWRWPDVSAELLVAQDVAEVLTSHRQFGGGVERGGQLFVNPANPEGLLLALATPPHCADQAGLSWLELNTERCLQEIETANVEGLRLVGYWHTHPQSIPSISPIDVASFNRFATRYMKDLPYPLAVIVGKSPSPNGIKAWSFRKGRYIEANWAK